MSDDVDFDPTAVPPDDDPLGDPAAADLRQRVEEARARLDALRPITNAGLFLDPAAIEAAAIVREHDLAYFYELHEALRPYRVLRIWLRAVSAAAKGLADSEIKVAEKTRLIAIAVELIELWHDGGEAWAWPREFGPACSWRVPGPEIKRYLISVYGERHQVTLDSGEKVPLPPGRQAVVEALDAIEAMAYRAPQRPSPALRVAGDGARLVLDLCRDDYAVAVVTVDGWEVVRPSPLAFRRSKDMLPLPLPVVAAGDALAELRTVLKFESEEHNTFWTLYVGFMFATLRPVPPYFILAVAGEQGAGKSTTVKVMRSPVDPHRTDIQPKPRSEDDLFVNCDGQRVVMYDNLSTLDQHWSDAFCRIATGSGYSKRKLHTDRDTASFQVARPQVITSITDIAAAPDLLDRSLLAVMPELETFTPEEELYASVAELLPRVLAQLLNAAVVALRDQKKVKLSVVPRMVGPTRWVEAAAAVLGLEPDEAFLHAYLESQERAGELALEASLIGGPIRDMLDFRDGLARLAAQEGQTYGGPLGFEGTSKQLLAELNDFMRDKPGAHGRGWPRTPKGMNTALRRIAPALRQIGYAVTFDKAGRGQDKHRRIVVDTPISYDHHSDNSANNRPQGPHRPQTDPETAHVGRAGDGGGGGDGRMQTRTNGGHKKRESATTVDPAKPRPSAAPKVEVGDIVQWAPRGVRQFAHGVDVTSISPDGGWVFVFGSATGLPIAEIEVVQKAGRKANGAGPAPEPPTAARQSPTKPKPVGAPSAATAVTDLQRTKLRRAGMHQASIDELSEADAAGILAGDPVMIPVSSTRTPVEDTALLQRCLLGPAAKRSSADLADEARRYAPPEVTITPATIDWIRRGGSASRQIREAIWNALS